MRTIIFVLHWNIFQLYQLLRPEEQIRQTPPPLPVPQAQPGDVSERGERLRGEDQLKVSLAAPVGHLEALSFEQKLSTQPGFEVVRFREDKVGGRSKVAKEKFVRPWKQNIIWLTSWPTNRCQK